MPEQTETGEWRCVDDRPFECPNGHGIMEIESSTSVHCPECGYSRTVIDHVTDGEPKFYVMGQRVKVRGFKFEKRTARKGHEYDHISAVIQFHETAETAVAELGQVKVEGGLSTIYNYGVENNMLPEWLIENTNPPWEREDHDPETDPIF